MNVNQEFDAWFERFFGSAQGEDSPYSYQDIKSAFVAGWNTRKEAKKP